MTEATDQEIMVVMFQHENGMTDNRYTVGYGGITKIEEVPIPGLHCNIPHIRVWMGEERVAEFCKHAIVGVWFKHSPPPEGGIDMLW